METTSTTQGQSDTASNDSVPFSLYRLLTKCEVKMASSFFVSL